MNTGKYVFFSFSLFLLSSLLPEASLGQTTGAIAYDTPTNRLRYYDGTAWVNMGGSTSLGACSTAGRINYNTTNSVMSYCNGTQEIDLTSQLTGTSCTTAGQLDFEAGLGVYRFCNGTNWVNTASPVLNNGYFVLTNTTYTGNLGGRSGADAACLTELTNQNWLEKSKASSFGILTSAHVYAFLCDSATGCLQLDPSSTYKFARAGSTTDGGSTFTTNASGLGPNDSVDWSTTTRFGLSASYWANRGSLSFNWSNFATITNDNCNNWSSTTGNGAYGTSATTSNPRWQTSIFACSTAVNLICVVYQTPKDFNPDAFTFPDLTNQVQGALVESAIVQVTGFSSPLQVTFSSPDWPTDTYEARVCSDASCSSVITGWTNVKDSMLSVSSGNYLQMRRNVAGNANVAKTITVRLGNASDNWSITSDSAGDSTPNSLVFTDLTNQATSTLLESNIFQVTGITAADVTGDGVSSSTPIQFRICSDSSCASVIRTYSQAPATIMNNQYIQLRTTSYPTSGSTLNSLIYVGTVSDTWSVSTTPNTTLGAFVLLNNSYGGNSLGGLAGADAICLTRLTADNFPGKLNVTLNSTNVKAFLCDNTTCNNLAASTTYMFGTVRDPDLGGATFTTNASGQGPNNSGAWSDSDKFYFSNTYWTGRAAGTATLWSLSASGTACTNWSATGTGHRGNSSSTTSTRWNSGTRTCTGSERLICFVNP